MAGSGYLRPTPVQSELIPAALQGADVLAVAQTGSGKTAGFVLPLLQHVQSAARQSPRVVKALVLLPTRELAMQVGAVVHELARFLPDPPKVVVVFGGVSANPQMMRLRGGADVLVATPGRLLDLVDNHAVRLSEVELLVLDEADRMLDMGFLPDIQKIIALLPGQRQNLMFSATFSDDIRRLSGTILRNPATVEVAARNATIDTIRQLVYPVDRDRKEALLAHLIAKENWRQVLVFTRTKIGATRLATYLDRRGLEAVAIHSDRSQPDRTRALDGFKTGSIRVLVATDVAARGLDIEDLPHVVNFELPWQAQDYIHRIGRTGRAGAMGDAVSLVSIDETDLLRGVQRLLKKAIPWTVEEGFIPDRNVEPEPLRGGTSEARPARGHHYSHRSSGRTRTGTGSRS